MSEQPPVPVPQDSPEPGKQRSFGRELPLLLLLALVLALLVKALLVQAFFIPSGSMQHTLELGDRVLVNKVVYRVRDVHRGEIVVFNGVGNWVPEGSIPPPSGVLQRSLRTLGNALGVSSQGEKDYIKRVIGVPGDRVMCCGPNGGVVVMPKGGPAVELREPYLFEASDQEDPRKYFCDAGRSRAQCPAGATGVLVPAGRLWVMGDHRGRSGDSRYYLDDDHAGTIPVNHVVGRAFAVVWPLGRLGGLRVPRIFLAAAVHPAAPYGVGLALAGPLVALRRRRRVVG